MRKQMGGPYSDLQPGDVIVSHGVNVAVIWEREVPDVPTRVGSHVCEDDDVGMHAHLPGGWVKYKGEDCTVILGNDDLPEAVKAFAESQGDSLSSMFADTARFIRTRWPEAF